MSRCTTLISTLLLMAAAIPCLSASTVLKVEDGVYSRITVRMGDDVPRQHCRRAINNVQALLTSTSSLLFAATDGAGRFADVSVVLPASWAGTECLDGVDLEDSDVAFPASSSAADFRVGGHDSAVFGPGPRVDGQFGGCGVPSRSGMAVPVGVVVDRENVTRRDESRTFLAWARSRYGVFPESGFDDGDALYPAEFALGADGRRSNRGCNATTDDDDDAALCPIEGYDRDVPTKQNLLCDRRSALEVVLDSNDFAVAEDDDASAADSNAHLTDFAEKIRNIESFDVAAAVPAVVSPLGEEDGPQANVFVPPRFSFVLPGRRRFVLALDVTHAVDASGSGRWERARSSLFRLFSHVPAGSEVAIVTFGSSRARIALEPTEVTHANRHGLLNKVPFRLREEDERGCVACALKVAAKLLALPSEADGARVSGSIILVSGSDAEPGSLDGVADAVEDAVIPVYNVAFNSACDEVDRLAKYGANFVVPQDHNEMLQGLGDIFLAIVNGVSSSDSIRKTHAREYQLQGDEVISGNFDVEESLNRDLWIILTTASMEDVEIFEVVGPSGVEHVFPRYENGLVYFHRPGPSETGVWSYRIKLYPTSIGRNVGLSVEVVASSDGHEDSVSVEGWTSVASGEGVAAEDEPVVIYASVKKGDLPVRDAMVVATVTRPGSANPVEIVLGDAGTGYPDVTAGDGIYSAYFTEFTSEPGLYSVSVSATHNGGYASVPKPELDDLNKPSSSNETVDSSSSDCCGSSVALGSYAIPTSSFEQHVAAPAFKITRGVQYFIRDGEPSVNDIFPPSRVTDFTVAGYVNQTLYATLAWTAPGGDYDQGRAARYEIRCYTNQDALSAANFANMGIPVHESLLPDPAEPGERQEATVGLPWANEIFYYGLVAVDEAGNRGPVSNFVPVFSAEATTTEDPDLFGNSVENSKLDGGSALSAAVLEALGSNGGTGYIVAGVVSGLVFILVIVVVITVCRARHRRVLKERAKNQRTQIFVNDIEPVVPNDAIIPDLTSEKAAAAAVASATGVPYGGIWTTTTSAGGSSSSGGNHSPSSEFSQEYNHYGHANGASGNRPISTLATTSLSMSDQASWAYLSTQQQQQVSAAPVHDYRPSSSSAEDAVDGGCGPAHPHAAGAPTYQNWTLSNNGAKPPSDNGTATTSSTECSTYESDQSEKAAREQAAAAAAAGVMVGPHSYQRGGPHHRQPQLQRRYSTDNYSHQDYSPYSNGMDPTTMSLSPSSFASEKRRRQESLV